MKQLNYYIIEKTLINKNTKLDNEDEIGDIHDRDDEITRDFRELYKLFKDEIGGDDICGYLSTMSDFNDDYTEFYYEYNPNKFANVLYCVVNYDLISLRKNGEIDVKNSNHPNIAKIMKKYSTKDIGKRIYDLIF